MSVVCWQPSEHAQAIFEVLSKLPDHFKYCPFVPSFLSNLARLASP